MLRQIRIRSQMWQSWMKAFSFFLIKVISELWKMQNAVLQGLVKPRTADMAPLILIFNAHAVRWSVVLSLVRTMIWLSIHWKMLNEIQHMQTKEFLGHFILYKYCVNNSVFKALITIVLYYESKTSFIKRKTLDRWFLKIRFNEMNTRA